MATKRPKVKSASGVDILLLDTDNLQLTAAPGEAYHGANKGYVDTQVSLEISNREDAIDDLQSQLNAEIDARTTGDSDLSDRIDTEEAARIAADASLQAQIDAEAQARADGDDALQSSIDSLAGDLAVIEGSYVHNDGDDMTGNLTFNTTNIVLNAATGAGTFAGQLEAANIDGGSY